MTMSTKTKIAFAVAMILGAGSAAMAGSENTEERGGYVIAGSTVGVNPAFHQDLFGNGAKAYGFAGSVNQTRRPAHDRR
jgi:hypothetical protein